MKTLKLIGNRNDANAASLKIRMGTEDSVNDKHRID